jgi:hypothetical protein
MELYLLSLGVALLLVVLFWPDQEQLPTDDYLNLLSPTAWKEEAQIYEQILKLHPMLTLNQHNRTLMRLHSRNKVERRIVRPHDMREIESPNRFGRTYTDHIEAFCTLTSVDYKLANEHGGKRTWFPSPIFSAPIRMW